MTGRGVERLIAALSEGKAVEVRGCRLEPTWVEGGLPIGVACCRHPVPLGTGYRGDCLLGRRGPFSRALARRLQAALAEGSWTGDGRQRALETLSRSAEPWARVDAARDPGCPRPVVERLATDWWWEVRAAVASHPGLPEAAGLRLAQDPSTWVRRSLAESTHLRRSVLEVLSADPDMGVRDAVAEHPACPAGVLVRLAADPVWEVRRSVAKRPNAPVAALAALAGDPEHWVRFFVACNPATPDAVRANLESDRRPSVRTMARRSAGRGRAIAMYLALEPGSATTDTRTDTRTDTTTG